MKLQSVNIKNFRCFEDITIDFHERLTVLVGGNGSGKSAVLDALNICASVIIKDTWNFQIDVNNKTLNSIGKQYLKFELSDGNSSFVLDNERYNSSNSKFHKTSACQSVCYYRSLYNITPIYNADGKYSYNSAFNSTYKNSLKWFSDKEAEEAKYAIKIRDVEYRIQELEAVREAVSQVLGDYDYPYTDKVPVDMFITKKGKPETVYNVSQLSNGYGTMLAFVMDLARMMAMANAEEYNKQGKSVLESPAIVLIDEVDLHLHPSWQQRVLPDLMRTFPNTQFIVTTHSPQVISSIAKKHIRVLEDGKVHGMNYVTEGVDSARILDEVFGVNPLPLDNSWAKKLNECQDFIYNGKWDSEKTINLLQELEAHYGSDYPPLYEMKLHRENLQWEKEHEND